MQIQSFHINFPINTQYAGDNTVHKALMHGLPYVHCFIPLERLLVSQRWRLMLIRVTVQEEARHDHVVKSCIRVLSIRSVR